MLRPLKSIDAYADLAQSFETVQNPPRLLSRRVLRIFWSLWNVWKLRPLDKKKSTNPTIRREVDSTKDPQTSPLGGKKDSTKNPQTPPLDGTKTQQKKRKPRH